MPFRAVFTALTVSVGLVAPARSVKVAPLLVLTCHSTLGAGLQWKDSVRH